MSWILAGLVVWAVLSVPVALWLGRAIRLANERQADLDVDLAKVEDQVEKLVAARSATRVMPVVRPLPRTAAPTPSSGKHARFE